MTAVVNQPQPPDDLRRATLDAIGYTMLGVLDEDEAAAVTDAALRAVMAWLPAQIEAAERRGSGGHLGYLLVQDGIGTAPDEEPSTPIPHEDGIVYLNRDLADLDRDDLNEGEYEPLYRVVEVRELAPADRDRGSASVGDLARYALALASTAAVALVAGEQLLTRLVGAW